MSDASPDPAAPAPRIDGRIVLLGTALGAVLTPVVVWCAMLVHDHFDPMCDGGAEGSLACVLRALAVTMISIVPGLLIGIVGGRYFASRRARLQMVRPAP